MQYFLQTKQSRSPDATEMSQVHCEISRNQAMELTGPETVMTLNVSTKTSTTLKQSLSLTHPTTPYFHCCCCRTRQESRLLLMWHQRQRVRLHHAAHWLCDGHRGLHEAFHRRILWMCHCKASNQAHAYLFIYLFIINITYIGHKSLQMNINNNKITRTSVKKGKKIKHQNSKLF